MNKEFSGEGHLDNYIALMERRGQKLIGVRRDTKDAQFQLETEQSTQERKESLEQQADELMNDVQPENVETIDNVENADPIPVKLEENTEPVKRTGIKRFKLKDIIGKKLNLLMADKLQIELQDPSKPYNQETNPYVKMGGNFFPLMEKMFGKVAWASIDKKAANKIIIGAMEGDMSAVYNMGDGGVDSNIAMAKSLDAALDKAFPPNDDGTANKKKAEVFQLIKDRVLKSKNTDIKKAHKHFKDATTLMEAFNSLTDTETRQKDGTMKKETVDVRSAVMNLIAPQGLEAKGKIELYSKLRELGISIETLRLDNTEQFAKDLPDGALTMIVEVQDEHGVPVRERKLQLDKDLAENKITKKEYDSGYKDIITSASMSLEQQKASGIPSHPNYPVYIRGKAVALMAETAPFFNLIKKYKDQISERVAGIDKTKSGKVKEGATELEKSIYDQINEAKKLINAKTKNPETNQYVAKEVVEALLKGDAKKLKGKLRSETIAQLKEILTLNAQAKIKEALAKVEIPFADMVQYSGGSIRSAHMTSGMTTSTTSYEITEYLKDQHVMFLDRLSKAFPSVEVVASQAEFDALIAGAQAKKLVTSTQKVYGAVFKGKLYLNPNLPNYNTPIHEFGHVWLNVAKELGKDTYKRGMELMTEESPYYQQVIKSVEYGKIIEKMREEGASDADVETYIKEEALATAIGDKGESFTSAAQNKNFKNWLNELFEFVGKLTGISNITPEQLQNITMDEFVQGVVIDLLSENEVFAGAEVKSFGEQLQLMTVPEDSMNKVIEYGRNNNFSDKAIKSLLIKRGFKATAINAAMTVNIDIETQLPKGFDRVEGGAQDAVDLFTSVQEKLRKFSLGNRKKIPAKKLTAEELKDRAQDLRKNNPALFDLSDAEILKKYPLSKEPSQYEVESAPTIGQVREKAMELMNANPIFKAQSVDVQLELLVAMDKTIGSSANKVFQSVINTIKNKISQRKAGIKTIKDAQKELKASLRELKITPEVRKIAKAVSNINSDNVAAQLEIISEMVESLTDKSNINENQKQDLRDKIKALKGDAKFLSSLKADLTKFMSDSLPKDDTYTKGVIVKAARIVSKINAKNFSEQVQKVMEMVEAQRSKMRKAKVKGMLAMAKSKATKGRTDPTKKARSKGLDAQGQVFFKEVARVLELAFNNDTDGMIALSQEISDLDNIDVIIAKEARGEKLTVPESELLDRVAAFDTFADIMSMTLEEVVNLDASLKDVRKESIVRLKANRLARSQEIAALSAESNEQVKSGFPDLYTMNGVLKTGNQLAKSAKAIIDAFKTSGFTAGTKAIVDNIGFGSKKVSKLVKGLVKDNMFHLGTMMDMLDKGGHFFKENIYEPLNVMDEKAQIGLREQMLKLDEMANSVKGITKGYKQIKALLKGKGMFVDGLESQVSKDMEILKKEVESGDADIKEVRKKVSDAVMNIMEAVGSKKPRMAAQLLIIRAQSDPAKLVKEQIEFIDALAKTNELNGINITKDGLLRLYALSKNDVQLAKMKAQGLTDTRLEEIKEFLGPELIEFADNIVEHLSNEYYESVNNVYSKTNDVNLDRIENYFPTKSLSQNKAPDFTSESFEQRFNAESPSSLKKRVDEKSGVNFNYTFTGELNNHIESMERYKAMAEGVKKIARILGLDHVKTLMTETGYKSMVNLLIDNVVTPAKTAPSAFATIANAFIGVTLGFKLMQLPKQATSFINAYSQYSLGKEGSKTATAGVFGADLFGFMYDVTDMVVHLFPNIRKARAMSATFDARVRAALEGDVMGLEVGISQDSQSKSEASRIWNVMKASPTTLGDIMGVMGYMAVYNRNIKNGMPQEQALKEFNDYNTTQQTRRGTELSVLQVNAKKTPLLRMLTMFGSTMILQLNNVASSATKITRDIVDGKIPNKRDVRSLYLNAGLANVIFIAAANIFKLINGDDDDKEAVLWEMLKAMVGINQIAKVPVIGSATMSMIYKTEGKPFKGSIGVGPLDRLSNQIYKQAKAEAALEVGYLLLEFRTKSNLDPFRSVLIDAPLEGLNDEVMYDFLGVSSSYRPGSSGGKKKTTTTSKRKTTTTSKKKKKKKTTFGRSPF